MSEGGAAHVLLPEAHDSDVESHVAVPVWLYVVVYVALLALTASTVAAAYVDLGPLNNVVAVGIAAIKAALVILYFMHVRWSSPLIKLVVLAAFLWLLYMLGGALSDYFTRGMMAPSR